MEALPATEGAEEVQLVQELHALVQQMPLQEIEDRGAMGESHGRGGARTKGERADMVW